MENTVPIRIQQKERDREAETKLMQALGIPRLVAAVLVQRDLADPTEADKFLNPKMDDLGDPTLLPDYESASEVILGAIERKEKIYIHGDYDVDGVTSAAIFTRFLEKIGADVHVHVPHRMKEGYGIHLRAVEEARQMGAKVFLTCDCGISAHEQVDAARAGGMTVVVTDHHTVPPDLPEAAALINPHRTDSLYPYHELSGAGVVFRFCEGLAREKGASVAGYQRAFLDLAVLGTVADVMPLTGENRIIARHGLKELWETKKEGLRALMKTSRLLEHCKDGLRAHHIGFQLGPRLNATGRIDDARRALDLLLSRDYAASMVIAEEIEALNTERRLKQDQIIAEAMEMVAAMDLSERYIVFVGNEGWHSGIVGLVASRLVEHYHRPAYVVVINPDTGMAGGSARSIPGFNLAASIRAFPDLVDGGGHAAAAGFRTPIANLKEVEEAFNSYARDHLTADDLIPMVEVDAGVDGDEVTFATVQAMQMLEPFGCANPTPMFHMRNIRLLGAKPTKNERIASVNFQGPSGPRLWGTTFDQAPLVLGMDKDAEFDAIFQPQLDEYNGETRLKFTFKYIEPAVLV